MTLMFIRKKARVAKALNMSQKKVWKPGEIFAAVTGKSVVECATIDDVDAAVSAALRLVGPMKFDGNDTGLVIRNGDVFPHVEQSAESNIDQKLDRALGSR